MHLLGLHGMPRRVYTYLASTGWGSLNLVASLGAAVIAVSMLTFAGNVVHALRRGPLAGDDPWEGETLEWTTASPPPAYNFATPPVVHGRSAAWMPRIEPHAIVGLRSEVPEVLVTTFVGAEPDHRFELPGPSLWPLALGLATGVTFITAIFTPWGIPIGAVLVFAALAGWFLPRSHA
jgi:hypothetical protein